jgi:hypothetical protein
MSIAFPSIDGISLSIQRKALYSLAKAAVREAALRAQLNHNARALGLYKPKTKRCMLQPSRFSKIIRYPKTAW